MFSKLKRATPPDIAEISSTVRGELIENIGTAVVKFLRRQQILRRQATRRFFRRCVR